jgi:LPXTG-motif cell wall-anchored protein
LIGVLAAVAFATLAFSGSALAADGPATFGKPSATSSFTGGIDFSQPVTVQRDVTRAELLLTIGDAIGQTVIPVVDVPGIEAASLTYHLDPEADGHLYPGTVISARWRLTGTDPTDVAIGPVVEVRFTDNRFDWKTVDGDLVTLHWYDGPTSFGERAARIGDDAVRQAADLLGVAETEPIDLYVYADQDAFYDALGPGTRENVGGAYIPGTRFMFALITPDQIDDSWVGVVVPHELTHLVFETAVDNPYHFPPRWLNEGLAVYLSQGYDASDRGQVEGSAGDGTLIPLDGLIGQFPTSFDRFSLAYAESVSAIDYLIRVHGRPQLFSLIRSYADGKTDDEAFTAALGVDMTAFGAAWMESLGAAAPVKYGPQSPPPGPVPAAWQGDGGGVPGTVGGVGSTTPPNNAPAPGPTTGSESSVVPVIAIVAVLLGVVGAAWFVRRRRAGPGTA